MKTLKVLQKEVYGRMLYYPRCPISLKFCELLGKKTLSSLDFKKIRELGYHIDYVLFFESPEDLDAEYEYAD